MFLNRVLIPFYELHKCPSVTDHILKGFDIFLNSSQTERCVKV